MKKLAIVGSRTFTDYHRLATLLDKLPDFILVSGGARGADRLAEMYARRRGLEMIIFRPDWNKFGKRAGFMRNEYIIGTADSVLAFWDGMSKGTKHDIDLANKAGKPCAIVRF